MSVRQKSDWSLDQYLLMLSENNRSCVKWLLLISVPSLLKIFGCIFWQSTELLVENTVIQSNSHFFNSVL